MEIEITPLNINDEILLNEKFWSVESLKALCNEARVLKGVQADALHWLNLGRRAFAAIDSKTIQEIENQTGVKIKKVKSKPMDRATSFSFRVSDPITGKNRMRGALLSFFKITAFRNESEVFVTAWR